MQPTSRTQTSPDGIPHTPKDVDAMDFLRRWKQENPVEYDLVIKHQEEQEAATLREVEVESVATSSEFVEDDIRTK